ncbi:MAG TPA: thiamine-binding protein [Acidimicrobiia bacterium]|jgi:uncharacterized protein YqgV (UPF0045/DUF77 family)
MPTCRAEFTIEPFEEGHQGPHVTAAIEAVVAEGLSPDVGPFGTAITGDSNAVVGAIARVIDAATGAGATRVTVNLEARP